MSSTGAALHDRRPASSPQIAARRQEAALWVVVGVGIALVLMLAVAERQPTLALGALVAGLVVVSYQRFLLAWRTLLAAILLVILFIPIRRYTVAGSLPLQLEPSRVVIALVLACWFCALAVDPRVRWRRTGFEGPILAVVAAMVLSMAANPGRVSAVSDLVLKQFSFFVSYLLVVYFMVSVVRSRRDLDQTLRLLVAGGTVVAVMSLVEWRTGGNLFNWYGRVMPFLTYVDQGDYLTRGTGVRAMGSAQHPIALGAALVMLLPLTVYLYRRDRRFAWMACGALMTLGALATGSRTGALMLVVLLVSFACIKPRETFRLAPLLLPLLIVCQIAMPGTLGTFKSMLNPQYIIKEQSYDQGGGAGRIADLGPALAEWAHKPLLGAGFGTRITSENSEAGGEGQILDDQWLGMLLEMGAAGVLGFLWLFAAAVRRLARSARAKPGIDGWLPTSLAASLIAFGVGMLTFDAFAFIQVMLLAFVMLGLTAIATRPAEPAQP